MSGKPDDSATPEATIRSLDWTCFGSPPCSEDFGERCVHCVVRHLLEQLAALRHEGETLRQERDVERSRFAFFVDKFDDLTQELDRRAHADWGHLRYRVLSTLKEAARLFRSYAAGQPSPSNWRRKTEELQAQLSALTAAQGQLGCHADVIRAARDRIDLNENDVPRQQVILRLSPDELGHLNELLKLAAPRPREKG